MIIQHTTHSGKTRASNILLVIGLFAIGFGWKYSLDVSFGAISSVKGTLKERPVYMQGTKNRNSGFLMYIKEDYTVFKIEKDALDLVLEKSIKHKLEAMQPGQAVEFNFENKYLKNLANPNYPVPVIGLSVENKTLFNEKQVIAVREDLRTTLYWAGAILITLSLFIKFYHKVNQADN